MLTLHRFVDSFFCSLANNYFIHPLSNILHDGIRTLTPPSQGDTVVTTFYDEHTKYL